MPLHEQERRVEQLLELHFRSGAGSFPGGSRARRKSGAADGNNQTESLTQCANAASGVQVSNLRYVERNPYLQSHFSPRAAVCFGARSINNPTVTLFWFLRESVYRGNEWRHRQLLESPKLTQPLIPVADSTRALFSSMILFTMRPSEGKIVTDPESSPMRPLDILQSLLPAASLVG